MGSTAVAELPRSFEIQDINLRPLDRRHAGRNYKIYGGDNQPTLDVIEWSIARSSTCVSCGRAHHRRVGFSLRCAICIDSFGNDDLSSMRRSL